MKTITPKNLFYTVLISIFFIGISVNGYAQCGTELITVTPWCENTYAEWTFNSPTANAQYNWYNYAAGPYTYDANGKLIKTGTTSISAIDSTTTNTYYSPFRVTTAGISPSTTIDFTYQKKVSYTKINPYPATTPAFSNGTTGSTFTMDFTTTLTSAVGLRFNYVTVPVVMNTVGKQYKIQVSFGTSAGPGSAIYTFSTTGATNIGGNNYLVTIPINYTLTASGAQKLVINTNPTGGTGSPVDGLLYASTQAPAFSAAGNPITIPAASAAAGPSGGFSQIYDWNYTVVCTPQNAGPSAKTTTGCCVVPSSLNSLALGSDKSAIVNGGGTNATLTVTNGSAANYFGWYLNGTLVPAASGIGKISYVTNLTGTWEVREVKNSSDISNPSCVSSASATIQDKKIFLTNVTNPGHTPLCIGDQWTFTGTGASSLTWSSGSGILSPKTGTSTTYTATAIGSDIITLTGNVPSGNVVVNGDFSINSYSSFSTAMTSSTNPTGTDGISAIASNSLNGGAWSNGDWTYNGKYPSVNGNPGNFLIVNGIDNVNNKSLIWGQSVTVQPGQLYNFAFDLTSVTYIVSNDPNVGNYSATTPTGTWKDVLVDVYVNGTKIGQASTNFAANGGFSAVGKWANNSFPWTAGATDTKAILELRQASPTTTDGRGYDYGLDNITFGGSITQTDTYNLGPVTDCSTITAAASACVNDTYTNLTATLTGAGLVFDHWELTSSPGVSVGTTNPLQVSSLTATNYTAVSYLTAGNLLDNGNFAAAGAIGFVSGAPYLNYVSAATLNGAQGFTVSTNTTVINSSAWNTLPLPPGATDNQVLTADSKGPVGAPIVGWKISVVAGQKYTFSGWAANQHVYFNPSSNTPVATQTAASAYIGIYVTTGTVSSTSYTSSTLLTSLKLPNTQAWNNLTTIWTAPTTGTYTIYAVDLNGGGGGGNDFVLDNFSLAPNIGITKTANVTTPVCNPCLLNIPTVGVHTYCANTGKVSLIPAETPANSVSFDWYDQLTGGTKLGNSVGKDTATLNIATTVPLHTVYYNKSTKGSGTVYKKNASCTMTTNGWQNSFGTSSLLEKYHASKTIQLTSALVSVRTVVQNTGCGTKGVITFNVIPALSNGNPDFASPIYGVLSGNYSRTKLTSGESQDKYEVDTIKGSVNIPAGVDFYIIPISITSITIGTNLDNVGQPCQAAQVYLNDGSDNSCDFTGSMVDDYDGTYVSRTGSYSSGPNGSTIKGGYTWNVKFNIPAYVCPRTPVTLTPSCPCTPPTSVTITPTTQTLCAGSNLTITGVVTLSATPPTGAYQYTWYKGTYSVANIVAGPSTTYSNFTKSGVVAADAGTYTLRVEDYTAPGANSSCYKEASVVITVNAATVPGVIATAQTICTGGDPAAFTVTTPASGGDGTTYTYAWEKSVNGAAYTAIGAATNATYDEGVLTNAGTTAMTVDYQRKVTSGVCPQVTTAAIRITVNPAVVAGVVAADQTICSGGDPAAFTVTTAPTGGSGTYTYQWQSSTTSTTAGFTNIATATNATYDVPGGLTTTTYYRRVDASGTCATANTNAITVTVQPALVAGAISAAQTICTGGDPAAFTVATAASGGNGTYTYQWEKSINAAAYADISGATNATYDEGVLMNAATTAMTVDYRRKVTSGACSQVTTAAIRITVNPAIVPGVVAGNQTICSGGDPAAFTQTTAASGGTGTFTYVWQSSTTSASAGFTNITPAATNATYDIPGGLTTTTYYRRVDASGTCTTANTNALTVTVTPNVTPSVTIATPATTICNGTSVTFTATPVNGGTTPGYQWYKGAVGSGTAIGAATNATYTTTTAANNDSYYLIMTSTATCPSPATATSNAIVMTVTTVVTPAVSITAAPGNTICAGASVTFTASPGNGGLAPTYEWFIGTTSQGAPSTTASTFTSTTLTNGNQVKVVMTSNSTCVVAPGTATSNVITMVVNPLVTPSVAIAVSPTGAICAGASLTFTATPTNGGTPTYQWYKGVVGSGTAIATATNATYTTTTAANNDSYYVIMTSTANCASPATATSTAIVTAVNPILVPSVTLAASPTTICTNGSTTFTATPTNPGAGPLYEWFINTVSQGAPAASATFSTTALTSSTDVVKVTLTSNALCATPTTASTTKSVTVNAGIGSGTVGIATATICYNTIPGALTQTAAPTGIAGTPTYTWEASPTGVAGSFVTIPGATNSSYTPTIAITQDAYIRRVITDPGTPAPCNVATSNTVHIIVNPQLVAGVIAGNETTCANVTTATITSTSAPTGGTGSYTYQWKSSATAGGPYTSITGATNTTYSPGILTSTTYFVRVETSGTCGNVTSNEITKTVNPVLVPGVTLAASPTTICTNGSTTFTATPTNPGVGPLYEWFINTVSQGAPAASATFSTTALTSSTDVVKVTLTSNALCATPTTASATKSVTVNAGIGSGTVGIATATICYNTIPGALTQTAAPTGIAGIPTYTWEASPTGVAGSFVTIPGATNSSYTPTIAITQDAYIRRVITDPGTPAPCNVATSNTVHIIVNPQLVAGVIAGNETTCSTASTATITSTSAPTGGTGSYTYQWKSSATAGGPYTSITGATNTTYSPGILTSTTYFVRVETSGGCGNVTSNEITKTVTAPEVVTVSINDPGQVCDGSAAFNFAATASTTGTGTLSYAWFLNSTPVGTNSANYSYSPVIGDNGKTVKVIVSTSNGCNAGAATSNLVTLNIVGATTPTVAITTNNNPNCAGLQTTFTATSTGGGSNPSYQWYVNSNTNPVGTGGTTYSSSALVNGDQVYVELTSNLGCLIGTNPFTSNKITMVIKPIPAPVITDGNQTVCSPATFTFHGVVGTGTTLQWKLNNQDIAGATNANYTATQSGTYTLYEDNGTCNSTSAPVTLNVVQTPVANAGSDIYIKEGDAGSLNGSGGAVYSWSPATYLSSTAVSNPTFTATQTITYTLTVSDASSTCSSTDDVTVFVVSPVEVPNVITVNGDGTNDDWEIKNIEGYPNVIIEIYNRWGNLVWKTQGYPKNWDGTNYRNGEVLGDGTYFYIINLHSEVYPEPLTGWIQIIK